MIGLLTATIILSIIHALIPNHWLPLVAVAKAEKWEVKELMLVGFASALAHVLGTIALGIVLGMVGLGLIYFSLNIPHHHHSPKDDVKTYKKSKLRWVLIFIGLMFLSPCLEVETLFLSAGAYGLNNVLLLSLVYGLFSVFSIVLLIYLVFKGSNFIAHNDFIEHNEKRITGMVLIIIGLITFFVH